ncbi:GNAT family N-acetyltransferase [Undibacterium sp. LX40W]|uniref:GNAT family N-acetyltransferase n=1 Tax=Undibacterium nitidum TaxID=2762298 RepID=A0A923KU21_9BURK|nr:MULTISPECIES: GNAT family N-acetyltransferase [Undibacterium]MBC3882826.1 GNAT family N-acetyltransferase [Undibacterium nitidum]MBC3892991.1 GNAT family N-acetyltransferase [Undibacterium sp. LX40W]
MPYKPMIVFQTERLRGRHFQEADAAFMLNLLNDPGWLRYIGERGVHDVEQARRYLLNGAIQNYQRLGFGFYLLESIETGAAVGMCGLAQREYLNAPDIGFALLAEYEGNGYAFEAAAACLQFAKNQLHLKSLVATTRLDNERSSRLLEKLGMLFKENMLHPDGDRYLKLYEINL